MIKAFLFDYDGVMTAGVENNAPAEKLAKNLSVSTELASAWISNMWNAYSTGAISEEESWNRIEAQYGQPIGPQQRDIWYKWEELTPLPEMVALIKELKSKGYAVGLLSNVFASTAALIREHGGYDGFDFLVLSCEAGARKADPKIYEIALSHLDGIDPSEVVFFDDREVCVAGAEAVGIKGIQLTDHAKAIAQVHHFIA